MNWSTTVTFHESHTLHPGSMDELSEIVRSSPKVRARGTAHCFNTIADSYESVVILDNMPRQIEIDSATQTAVVSAGLNYAEISESLEASGWALHNLASLPHISIGGAVSTGSHGSGVKNGALHTAVKALTLMLPDGSVKTLRPERDPEFFASVVGLGLTGIAINYELAIEPSYRVFQSVYAHLPLATFTENLVEILSGAYSICFFTNWVTDGEIWMKSRKPNPTEYFGAKPRAEKVHPIVGHSPEACTDQLGIPGRWLSRLTHFRIDANPSAGNEIQSEFFVEIHYAQAAFKAVMEISPIFREKLLVSEIRTIASDEHWMSPAYRRDTVAIHFTWKNDYEVPYLISLIEEALAPFSYRPHMGKVFNMHSVYLAQSLPKLREFKEFVSQIDPEGKFHNNFTRELFEFN